MAGFMQELKNGVQQQLQLLLMITSQINETIKILANKFYLRYVLCIRLVLPFSADLHIVCRLFCALNL